MPENGLYVRCSCGARFRAAKWYVTDNSWHECGDPGTLQRFFDEHGGYSPYDHHTISFDFEDDSVLVKSEP